MTRVLVCHTCVANYEAGDRALLGHPGDAAFPIRKGEPDPTECPRCRSIAVTVVIRANPVTR